MGASQWRYLIRVASIYFLYFLDSQAAISEVGAEQISQMAKLL